MPVTSSSRVIDGVARQAPVTMGPLPQRRPGRDRANPRHGRSRTLDAETGAHVGAIGVRRRHRGHGIGRALIERALEREGRLTARFDDRVRPFYERLGFSIEPIDEQRHSGVVVATDSV